MDLDNDDILNVKELSSDDIVDVNTNGSSKNANYELMVEIYFLALFFLMIKKLLNH